jgi:hypothetical protein
MNGLTSFAVAALFLGMTIAIASLLTTGTRKLAGVIYRRRQARQSQAVLGAPTGKRRANRRRRHPTALVRRTRRYW